jgi:hypothetical protein
MSDNTQYVPYMPRVDDITAAMAKYGWTHLWYANPFHLGTEVSMSMTIEDEWVAEFGEPSTDLEEIKHRKVVLHYGPRWCVGVWTGREGDLVCLKHCDTNEEAKRWLSPGGWTPDHAVRQAIAKIEILTGKDQASGA